MLDTNAAKNQLSLVYKLNIAKRALPLCTLFHVTCLHSCIVSQRKQSTVKERESKKGRVERGRESLVKWNLVTDASEGARPCGEEWRFYVVRFCVAAR